MHQKSNFYIYFGIWVAVLPFIGAPGVWKTYLTLISGLILVFYAGAPILVKKLQAKSRTRKRAVKSQATDLVDTELRFNPENTSEVEVVVDRNSSLEKDEKTSG